MFKNKQCGFTLTELLVYLSILCVFLVFFGCGDYSSVVSNAKEVEAKANLHSIQIAVERYNTDHHEYPPYLLGGDWDGWDIWHKKNDEPDPDPEEPANRWVYDPLIAYNYMHSYPENPFVDWESGMTIIRETSFAEKPQQGDGDPRFGYKGNIMGMGLDDPNFFGKVSEDGNYYRIETRRTLDCGKYNPSKKGYPDRNANSRNLPGLYYNSGGRFDATNSTVHYTFWPGSFFYRSAVDMKEPEDGWGELYPNTGHDGPYNRYMLGVWGDRKTPGKDVIRLQDVTPDFSETQVYWRFPSPWTGEKDYPCGYTGRPGEPLGLPAVFGGGDHSTGPFYPENMEPDNLGHFIYGAPDGVKDGIILVLTTGTERHKIIN